MNLADPNNLSLIFPLAVGIGSSFSHCIGMCGPIQLAISARAKGHLSLLVFHSGRSASYIVLGIATGAFGMLIHGRNHPYLMIGAKILIIILFLLLAVGFWGFGSVSLEKFISKMLPNQWLMEQTNKSMQRNLFLAGIFTGFLPCPTTFAVLGWSLSLNSPLKGGLSMALLGLATAPSFILIWYSLGWKKLWSAPAMYKVLSLVFLGFALWKVYQLFHMGGMSHSCH